MGFYLDFNPFCAVKARILTLKPYLNPKSVNKNLAVGTSVPGTSLVTAAVWKIPPLNFSPRDALSIGGVDVAIF